jgi:hypothetical protein
MSSLLASIPLCRFGSETVVTQEPELKISSGAADQDPGKKKITVQKAH